MLDGGGSVDVERGGEGFIMKRRTTGLLDDEKKAKKLDDRHDNENDNDKIEDKNETKRR
jgi:hypothetical protein